jgi:hypothetical protein
VTAHNGQRKSSCKKDLVTQRSFDQAAEATRLNKLLEIENQDLRRQLEELQAASQARAEEHLCIIQQALEERGSTNTRISNLLYRRIKRHAPSVLEQLPHVINRLGDITLCTRDSSSVSSLDPRSESSSRSRLSDCLKREAQVFGGLDDSRPKRQCPTNFEVDPHNEISALTRVCSSQMPKETARYAKAPCFGPAIGHARSSRQYAPISAHDTSTQPLSDGSDFHQPQETNSTFPTSSPTLPLPSFAHMPTRFYQETSVAPQARSPRPRYWTISASERLYNPSANSEFDAMDYFNDQNPDYTLFQNFENWDSRSLANLLGHGTDGGESVNGNLLGDLPSR